MEFPGMTQHALIRQQQRGISTEVLGYLLKYGHAEHDNRGAEVLYFDKRARNRCLREIGKDTQRKINDFWDVYAVRREDGAILTVGHCHKRIQRM